LDDQEEPSGLIVLTDGCPSDDGGEMVLDWSSEGMKGEVDRVGNG